MDRLHSNSRHKYSHNINELKVKLCADAHATTPRSTITENITCIDFSRDPVKGVGQSEMTGKSAELGSEQAKRLGRRGYTSLYSTVACNDPRKCTVVAWRSSSGNREQVGTGNNTPRVGTGKSTFKWTCKTGRRWVHGPLLGNQAKAHRKAHSSTNATALGWNACIPCETVPVNAPNISAFKR